MAVQILKHTPLHNGVIMKKLIILISTLLSFQAMALTGNECLQQQVESFNKTKLNVNFSQVIIKLRDQSRSSDFAPIITVEGSKLTIEPIFSSDGICVVANKEYIEEEVNL